VQPTAKSALAGGQVHRRAPRAVGKVPDGQRPHFMRALGDVGHVVTAAGAVVDFGDQRHGNAVVDGGHHLFRGDGLQPVLATQGATQAFGHVKVRGEVAGVRQDHPRLGFISSAEASAW
jgi:hypothetical protein